MELTCFSGTLTLSRRRPISYRNQSIELQSKSMDWFLYDIGLRRERVNFNFFHINGFFYQYLFIEVLFLQFLGTVFVCFSCLRKFEIYLLAFSTIQEICMELAFPSGTVLSIFLKILTFLCLCLPLEGNFLEFFNKKNKSLGISTFEKFFF